MTGAGQIVRRDVAPGQLSIQVSRAVDEPLGRPLDARVKSVAEKNVAYIAQLRALEAFYAEVRLGRARRAARAGLVVVYEEALANVGVCLAERVTRLKSFLREHGAPALPELGAPVAAACPLPLDAAPDESDHVKWIKTLSAADADRGQVWLEGIAQGVRDKLRVPDAAA
jgi:UDP-N-acetylglucosamine/UDP-N-acetylgalactosamine diphosphorylase